MIVNNIQPFPKQCLPMPLARVGARTDSTTLYNYNARRDQFARMHFGIESRTRRNMQNAPRVLHFSDFHIFCFDENLSQYISVPSLVERGPSIGKLHA